ncbi:hypothetical protein LSTR_LSTR017581 [Laodelphax striatellus]|uniref:Uncharacterized protein n=1 Tax=Laodelphax striatellus TaxID=195883 RepID=A0A482X583_LAOST|nr:hypothetical protein LSTR_LSTR017581 [Laodelphax striatellus]
MNACERLVSRGVEYRADGELLDTGYPYYYIDRLGGVDGIALTESPTTYVLAYLVLVDCRVAALCVSLLKRKSEEEEEEKKYEEERRRRR